MADDDRKQNWWTTLPGFLTAAGAFITALTGLLVGLNQLGLLPVNTKTQSSPTPALSSTAGDSNPSELTKRPPDFSGDGTAPWFDVGDERIAISRVVDDTRQQSGVYFRNAGSKRIYVRFHGDCSQPSCNDGFYVSPIAVGSQAADDPTVGCAADGHLAFDTTAEFKFHWDIWVTSASATVVGC